MGCFNGKGVISKLPITHGQRVGGIICRIIDCNYDDQKNQRKNIVVPAFPIIWGKYDDYGSIDDVKLTASVELLNEIFENNTHNILRAFERLSGDCGHQLEGELDALIDKRENFYECREPEDKEDYIECLEHDWCMILEHEDVLKMIINECRKDIEKLYNKDIEKINSSGFLQKIGPDKFRDILFDLQGCNYLRCILEFNDPITEEEKTKFNKKLAEHSILKEITCFPNPGNDRCFFSFCWGDQESRHLLDLMRNYGSEVFHKMFTPEFKEDYIDIISFARTLYYTNIYLEHCPFPTSQDPCSKFWRKMIKTYSKIVKEWN